MSGLRPKVLLVEGQDEVRTLPYLLEAAGIPWPQDKRQAPFYIQEHNGIEDLLEPGAIEAQLKASGAVAVGILVDADGSPSARWQRIRQLLESRIPDLPEMIPADGLVHGGAPRPRVGVWIMPDNTASGMLESMLLRLRHSAGDALKAHVLASLQQACSLGAPIRPSHYDKGELHTWLAWQEPPGLQMHMAVQAKQLRLSDETTEVVAPFVQWVKQLFELP